jgi:phosphoribosylformylglycinamidine cyclo-ligase
MADKEKRSKITYADSGVDIRAGEQVVERMKQLVAETFNDQVLSGLGAFGGFFKPDLDSLVHPVFLSSTDSVGTKLKLAFMTNRHDTVGEDLVNHCVNDILVHGARALFFLDYIGIHKVDPNIVAELVAGLSRGCKNNGVALIGGETAELTDMYHPGEYDLVGFVVGVVDEIRIVNGSTIKGGDICLGLSSNGLHTNGYTLARKVAFEIAGLGPDDYIEDLQMTIAEALMKVHRSYAGPIHPLLDKYDIHGMAHITGGGVAGNLVRVLPDGVEAVIDKRSWPVPAIFNYLQQAGNIDPYDIYSAFNMGIGYIIVVSPGIADDITTDLEKAGETVYRIGEIRKGEKAVRLVD